MTTNRPVVANISELPSSRGRKFIASALLAVSLGVVSLQAGFVLNAEAESGPITSPATSAETSPSPSITPSATPEPSAPVTSPEVSPLPSTVPSTGSQANTGSSSNGGGGSSNNSGGGAASCNNEAPKAPRIISAVTTGKNEITLNWEKPVVGNVTHYSVAYGLSKNKPLYGVANVGNVTSFKISGLAGGVTYYFSVKAVNDCTPGESSNEVAVKVGGKFINSPAEGFSPVVLGKTKAQIKSNSAIKAATSKPAVFNNEVVSQPKISGGLAAKVASFFKGLFN